jgi:hypothetical protein
MSIAGIGVVRTVTVWGCGFVFATIIHAIIACLSYYSIWMLLHVMKVYKVCRFTACWNSSGLKGWWVLSVLIIAVIEVLIAVYFDFIWQMWTELLSYNFTSLPAFVTDPYLLHVCVIVVIFLPIVTRRDQRFLAYFSWIKAFLLGVFYAINVYWCYTRNRDWEGDRIIAVFDTSAAFFDCVRDYVAIYLTFFCIWTPLINLRDFTFDRGVTVIRSGYIVFFIFSHSLTLIQHFTFYGTFSTDNILYELDMDDVTVQIAFVIVLVHMVLSIAAYLDPVRQVGLEFVQRMEVYPQYIWVTFGYIWLLFALLMSPIMSHYLNLVASVANTFPMILQFIAPAIMMGKLMNTGVARIHWVGVVVLPIIGAFGLIYSVLSIAGVL